MNIANQTKFFLLHAGIKIVCIGHSLGYFIGDELANIRKLDLILHIILVKLIGRQFSALVFLPFLKIGVISPDLQSKGKNPCDNEVSNISLSGKAIMSFTSF
jgi:hypothetical protein